MTVVQQGAAKSQPDRVLSADPDLVVDFAAQPLDVLVAADTRYALGLDGALGKLTRLSGQLTLDVFGFLQVSGGFALEKSIDTVVDSKGRSVEVDRLTVGGGGVDAFVGVGGGTADALGLQVEELDFGLALYTERNPATGKTAQKWSALTATANSVALTGVSEITVQGESLQVEVNRAAADGTVLDFAGANAKTLATGPGTEITLGMAGTRGALLRAEGDLTLQLSDFVHVDGRLGFERSQPAGLLTLSGGSRVTATSVLTVHGLDVNAFVGHAEGGFDGTKSLTQQAATLYGIGAEGVDFGLAVVKAGGQTYTGLKARLDDARLYGFDAAEFELSAQELSLQVNRAGADGKTLDFAASFPGGGLALGSTGEVRLDLQARERLGVYATGATLSLGGFVHLSGAFGFERGDFGNALRAGNAATQVTGAKGFSIGGTGVTAFVGYAEGGIDRSKTLAEQAANLYGFGA